MDGPDDTYGCNHDTGFHMRLLVDAAHGRLRHCPTCGATAYGPPYSDFGDPRADWLDAWKRSKKGASIGVDRVSRDWSKPRPMPWLPWDHPNYYVTSHREAIRVCKDWGIDPERGGFISEAHRQRAAEAGRRNRAAALAKWTPAERAQRAAVRVKARAGNGKKFS